MCSSSSNCTQCDDKTYSIMDDLDESKSVADLNTIAQGDKRVSAMQRSSIRYLHVSCCKTLDGNFPARLEWL